MTAGVPEATAMPIGSEEAACPLTARIVADTETFDRGNVLHSETTNSMAEASTFTTEDRTLLVRVSTLMERLQLDFDNFRGEYHDASSPTAKEFGELRGKVESLQQFRWWVMGAAAGAGALAGFILDQLRGKT